MSGICEPIDLSTGDAGRLDDLQEIEWVARKIARDNADLAIWLQNLKQDSPFGSEEIYDKMRRRSSTLVTGPLSPVLAFGKKARKGLDLLAGTYPYDRYLISPFERLRIKLPEFYDVKIEQADERDTGEFSLKVIAGMPAFNEEKFIAKTIVGVQKFVDHVLVVDDGSTDATREIAQNLGAIVVSHPKNRGYGATIRSIFEKARELQADALVIIDSDGQHDPKDVELLVERLKEDDIDIVIGSRFVGRRERKIPAYRIFGMKILDRFTRFAGADSNTDSQSGFRAYNKKAINSIRISGDGMSVGSEILIQAAKNKLKMAEIPIEVRYDIEETSSQNPVSHGISIIYNLIGLISYQRPLPAFGIPGVLLVIIGFVSGSAAFTEYYSTTKFPFVLSMVSAVFLIMGLLLLIGALILNYLVVFVKEQKTAVPG
jgi:glycosyltransferase involved in cell wall biosynthesis